MSRSSRWMSHLIKKKDILLPTFLLFRFSGDLLNCPCWWGPSLPHLLVQSLTPSWNTFTDTPTHNVFPNVWASLSTSGRCTKLTIYPTEGNSHLEDNSWVYLFLIMWKCLILEIINWIVSLSRFTCQCDLTDWAKLACQIAPGNHPCQLPQAWDYKHRPLCLALLHSAVPTESPPSPFTELQCFSEIHILKSLSSEWHLYGDTLGGN